MNTPHIGSFRGTRYFAHAIRVGPNSIVVDASEHAVAGSRPARLELHEKEWTQEEIDTLHAALTLIEQKYEEEHDRLEVELEVPVRAPRAKVHEVVKEHEEAKKTLDDTKIQLASLQLEVIGHREAAMEAEKIRATAETDRDNAIAQAEAQRKADEETIRLAREELKAAHERDVAQLEEVRKQAEAATRAKIDEANAAARLAEAAKAAASKALAEKLVVETTLDVLTKKARAVEAEVKEKADEPA